MSCISDLLGARGAAAGVDELNAYMTQSLQVGDEVGSKHPAWDGDTHRLWNRKATNAIVGVFSTNKHACLRKSFQSQKKTSIPFEVVKLNDGGEALEQVIVETLYGMSQSGALSDDYMAPFYVLSCVSKEWKTQTDAVINKGMTDLRGSFEAYWDSCEKLVELKTARRSCANRVQVHTEIMMHVANRSPEEEAESNAKANEARAKLPGIDAACQEQEVRKAKKVEEFTSNLKKVVDRDLAVLGVARNFLKVNLDEAPLWNRSLVAAAAQRRCMVHSAKTRGTCNIRACVRKHIDQGTSDGLGQYFRAVPMSGALFFASEGCIAGQCVHIESDVMPLRTNVMTKYNGQTNRAKKMLSLAGVAEPYTNWDIGRALKMTQAVDPSHRNWESNWRLPFSQMMLHEHPYLPIGTSLQGRLGLDNGAMDFVRAQEERQAKWTKQWVERMQSEAYTKCKDDINAWLEMRGGMKFTSLDAVRVAMPTLGGLIHAHLMHTAKKMKVNCYLDMNVDVTQRPFVQGALHTLQNVWTEVNTAMNAIMSDLGTQQPLSVYAFEWATSMLYVGAFAMALDKPKLFVGLPDWNRLPVDWARQRVRCMYLADGLRGCDITVSKSSEWSGRIKFSFRLNIGRYGEDKFYERDFFKNCDELESDRWFMSSVLEVWQADAEFMRGRTLPDDKQPCHIVADASYLGQFPKGYTLCVPPKTHVRNNMRLLNPKDLEAALDIMLEEPMTRFVAVMFIFGTFARFEDFCCRDRGMGILTFAEAERYSFFSSVESRRRRAEAAAAAAAAKKEKKRARDEQALPECSAEKVD